MARKNLKWQIHEAVMDSKLDPPARLLMFVFADLANAETGEIPEERKSGASIKELARRTGHDAATVKRHKRNLIALGWLKYDAPDGKQQSSHETGDYTIMIGRNPDPKPEAQSTPPPVAQSAPPEGVEENTPEAQSAPPGGAQCATGEAQSAPPIKGITDTDKSTNISLGPNADASAPRTGTKRTRKPKDEAPPRADVDALCQRLAELMIANECKPPTITDTWRTEARRMLDLDGRPFDKAMALLEWCQNDPFWKTTIHSMPKFRAQYDQLRMRAVAEWEKTRAASPRRTSAMQQRIDEGLERAERMRLLDEAEARGERTTSSFFSALPPGTLEGLT